MHLRLASVWGPWSTTWCSDPSSALPQAWETSMTEAKQEAQRLAEEAMTYIRCLGNLASLGDNDPTVAALRDIVSRLATIAAGGGDAKNAARERHALAELVACKDLKEKLAAYPCFIADQKTINERMAVKAEYRRRQPLAWAAPRKALSAPAAPGKTS